MPDDGLTAGVVARRLGVAVTTLRTWHQRYGLGPSHHVPGHHRRYTGDDLARLDIMRRLTDRGVAPAEAAAWALRYDPGTPPPLHATGRETSPEPGAPTTDRPTTVDLVWPRSYGPVRYDSAALQHSRDGGGNTIPVGRAGPAARGFARAAMRLDAQAMRDILQRAVQTAGVVATWDDIVVPVLVGIGERHAATRRLVEVEHLASRCVTEVLSLIGRPAARRPPQVLLACADEEQHTLALEALAAALAEAGTPTRLLGARVPQTALVDAIDRTGPAAVVLWSQLPTTADPAQIRGVLEAHHRPILVAAAGPGWSPETLPADVPHLTSLSHAVQVTQAV